jgi:hypothetical protein
MTGRLQQQCPDLAAIVEGLAEAERGPRVRLVVESVAATTGVADECRSASDLAGLVSRLDDEAWTLQANESSTDYERAFKRARAANAWLFAATDPSVAGLCEAIYEAIHALDGQPEQIAALLGA